MSQTSEIFSSKMTADVSGDAIIAIGFFIGFFVLDTLFKIFGWFKNDKTGRYLSLHIICNAIVVALSFEDTITTYRQPAIVSYMAEFTDTRSCVIILSLHLYHIAAFQPLATIDWIHHGVMIIVMLPFAYAMQPGPMLNHGCFFASGLPGGMDYVMLVCVKKGWMKSIDEKKYNSIIQTWIRNPGMLFHALFTWTTFIHCYGYPDMEQKVRDKTMFQSDFQAKLGVFIIISTYFWNGIYFQSRVVDNYARKEMMAQVKIQSNKNKNK